MQIAPSQPFNPAQFPSFRIPKPGETAPQAPVYAASLSEVQAAIAANPTLQFTGAKTSEEYTSVTLTNAAQLAQKSGKSDQLAPIFARLGVSPPSSGDLASPDALKQIQERVEKALHHMPRDKANAITEEISLTFGQLLHEAGAAKGGIINTSA